MRRSRWPRAEWVSSTRAGRQGQPLRVAPSPDERERLIDAWYRPHHRALTVAVDGVLAQSGVCLVLDCHSFPSVPLPYEPDQSPDRAGYLSGHGCHAHTGLVDGACRCVFCRCGLSCGGEPAFRRRFAAGRALPAGHARHRVDGGGEPRALHGRAWRAALAVIRRVCKATAVNRSRAGAPGAKSGGEFVGRVSAPLFTQ